MKNKKILLISLRADVGGGPKHLDSVFQNLKGQFDFFIASPNDFPYGQKWCCELEKKFFQLPHRRFSISVFIKLIFFVWKNHISLVHAHGKGAGIYARLIKIFLPKTKIIFTWHGLHIDKYNSFEKFIYILLERFLSIFTDFFINVSESERKICLQNNIYKIDKSIVINNGIKDDYKNSDKNILRKELNLPLDKFIIINVSRFDKKNNLRDFILISSLFTSYPEILFLICGDGEEKQNILSMSEKLNLKNILLTGFITNPVEYLSASDIYLSTSLSEGLPYSLLEASMCKLPIIASDVRGNNEIVSNNTNGFLFSLNNISQAAEYILKLKNDKDNYQRFSDNARKIFLDKFAEQKMILKLKEVYEKIIL